MGSTGLPLTRTSIVQVRAGAEPRRAHVADGLAARDVGAGAHGQARLMRVQRREAVTVVDDDHVAVAAHPRRVDDGAGGRGADGHAVAHPDVDAGVELLVAEDRVDAPAEGGRDRTVHRPAEAARASAGAAAAADDPGERLALGEELALLTLELGEVLVDALERARLLPAHGECGRLARRLGGAQGGELVALLLQDRRRVGDGALAPRRWRPSRRPPRRASPRGRRRGRRCRPGGRGSR